MTLATGCEEEDDAFGGVADRFVLLAAVLRRVVVRCAVDEATDDTTVLVWLITELAGESSRHKSGD